MNNRAPFQVIAIIPSEDSPATERVKQAVATRFDLDLQHYSREFQKEGVCIQHALTLDDALKTAMVVQDLGASCRVLDATGQVVTEEGPTASPDEDDEPELELDADRSFAAAAEPSTTRDLAADDLVMLDGAIGDVSDEAIPELGEVEEREASTAQPEIEAPSFAFVGSPLDLDNSEPDEATEYEDPGAMEFSELSREAEARERKEAAPAKDDDDGGLFKELDDSLSGKPSSLAMATEEELHRQPVPAVRKPSLDDVSGSRSRRPSQAVAVKRRGPGGGISRKASTVSSGGVVMFGGFFRDRPRLRILVGFLLALGLGSIVPAVHASGAFTQQVKPLLSELSTARANEKQDEKAPFIPSSRSVEEKLDTKKTENFAYTLAIWVGCFIGIAILWFRFC